MLEQPNCDGPKQQPQSPNRETMEDGEILIRISLNLASSGEEQQAPMLTSIGERSQNLYRDLLASGHPVVYRRNKSLGVLKVY